MLFLSPLADISFYTELESIPQHNSIACAKAASEHDNANAMIYDTSAAICHLGHVPTKFTVQSASSGSGNETLEVWALQLKAKGL